MDVDDHSKKESNTSWLPHDNKHDNAAALGLVSMMEQDYWEPTTHSVSWINKLSLVFWSGKCWDFDIFLRNVPISWSIHDSLDIFVWVASLRHIGTIRPLVPNELFIEKFRYLDINTSISIYQLQQIKYEMIHLID